MPHTHSHIHTLSLTHTLSLSLSHTHTLSLSHTHTLSLSHTHYLGEREQSVGPQQVRSVPVHVAAACGGEGAQRVQRGRVQHQTHVVSVQHGAQELRRGVLQRLQAVAVRQAQEVQQELLVRGAETSPARVQILQQHLEGFGPRVLQTHLGLRLRLLHAAVQESPAENITLQLQHTPLNEEDSGETRAQ